MIDNGTDVEKQAQWVSLEFVNVNAGTAAERKHNRKVVRSTAMRDFRHRQKLEKHGKSHGKNKGHECPNSEVLDRSSIGRITEGESPKSVTSRQVEETKSQPHGLWLIVSPSSSFSWDTSTEEKTAIFGKEEDGNTMYLAESTQDHLTILSSPTSILGAGRVDPFRSSSVNVHELELIDHSYTILWNGLRPHGNENEDAKLSLGAAWLEKTRSRPLVFHAMLFGAQVHMDVLRSHRLPVHNPTRLIHKVMTMRLLKQELQSTKQSCLDDIILAVLTLSANEVETMVNCAKKRDTSPFNSPLKSTQWLDVYGSITHLSTHIIALRSLVERRGGLGNVELRGLAEVLSFSDILGASQTVQKPHWPLLEQPCNTPHKPIPRILTIPTQRFGQGFRPLPPSFLASAALKVIDNIIEVTTTIDAHIQGVQSITNMTAFIDRRNAAQHSLLSLPTGGELLASREMGEDALHIYDAIRIALMIYSAAVTFPLPATTGVFHRLACALKNAISRSPMEIGSEDNACETSRIPLLLSLWMLLLGGIAASGTEKRSWYVDTLVAVRSSSNLKTWEEVEWEMGRWLWLDSACGSGGRELWNEVMSDK